MEKKSIEALINDIQKMSIWEFAFLFQKLQLKNLGAFKALHKIKAHKGIVRRILFCKLGKSKNLYLISCGVDKLIQIWDVTTSVLFKTLEGHRHHVYKLMIIKHNKTPYLCSSSSDRTIKIWSLKTFKLTKSLIGHTSTPYSMLFIKKKKLLVSGDWDGNLIFWNLNLGTMLLSIKTYLNEIWSLYYDERISCLIVGSRASDKLSFYDMKARAFTQEFKINEFTNPNFVKFIFEIDSIKIHPDINEFLICSGSNNVALINKDYSLKQFSVLKGHSNQVRSFVFCKKLNFLITASCDRRVRIWKMEFDKNNNKLVIKEEENLESPHTDNINCVAIDEDENYLATCSWDGEILIYSLN